MKKKKRGRWNGVGQMLAMIGLVLLSVLAVGCENIALADETTGEQNNPDGGDETNDDPNNDSTTGGGTAIDVSGSVQGIVDPYTGDVATYSPDSIQGQPAGTYYVGVESESESATWLPSTEQNLVDSDDDFSFTLPVPDASELLTATDAFGAGISSSNGDARFELAYFGAGTSEDDGLSLSLANRESNGTITYVQYIYASEATTLSGSSTDGEGSAQFSTVSLEAGWNDIVVNGELGSGLFGQVYDITYVDDSVPTGLQWLIVDDTVKLVSPSITFENIDQQGTDPNFEYDTEIIITQGADTNATPPTAELYITFGVWHTNPSPVPPDGNYQLDTGGSTGDGPRMGAIYMGSDAVHSSPPDFSVLITENPLQDLEAGSGTYDTYYQATTGTVAITDQGSGSYTVSWDLTLSNGDTVEGQATATALLEYGGLQQ